MVKAASIYVPESQVDELKTYFPGDKFDVHFNKSASGNVIFSSHGLVEVEMTVQPKSERYPASLPKHGD
jgi:hypothetical protein